MHPAANNLMVFPMFWPTTVRETVVSCKNCPLGQVVARVELALPSFSAEKIPKRARHHAIDPPVCVRHPHHLVGLHRY
ncbi:MAG: hypothetical protein O3A37_13830, partial [Planctomycetota bacterium]|nr:hypothetical protein [Planctomycetota bacterium]